MCIHATDLPITEMTFVVLTGNPLSSPNLQPTSSISPAVHAGSHTSVMFTFADAVTCHSLPLCFVIFPVIGSPRVSLDKIVCESTIVQIELF